MSKPGAGGPSPGVNIAALQAAGAFGDVGNNNFNSNNVGGPMGEGMGAHGGMLNDVGKKGFGDLGLGGNPDALFSGVGGALNSSPVEFFEGNMSQAGIAFKVLDDIHGTGQLGLENSLGAAGLNAPDTPNIFMSSKQQKGPSHG